MSNQESASSASNNQGERSCKINIERTQPDRASGSSFNSRNYIKKAKTVMQLAVFVIIMIMFVMNLFRGTPQEQQQTSQILYKMLDMPELGSLSASNHPHVHINRTAN